MNKKPLIIIFVGVAILISVGAWFFWYQSANTDKVTNKNYIGNSAEECSRIQVLCIAGLERFDDESGCGCQPVTIPADWKLYSSDTVGFSIKYDPSLTLSEDNNTNVRLYKIGPTQRGQTEMYDGIILSVRKISTEDWRSYINAQLDQYKDAGTITEPLHDGILNGISVKEYSASGLGDFKIIFVSVDDQTLLEISYTAPDPTDVGFQKTIDMMLSTFSLN